MKTNYYSGYIAQATATDCGYTKVVEFIETHKNEIEFVGILNRDRLLNDESNSHKFFDMSKYKKNFAIVYNKQCGYVNGIHQEELRKLFFEDRNLYFKDKNEIVDNDPAHQVNIIRIIVSNTIKREDLIAHGMIPFNSYSNCNKKKSFTCLISNTDEYDDFPVKPAEDIDKKISKLKCKRISKYISSFSLSILWSFLCNILFLKVIPALHYEDYSFPDALDEHIFSYINSTILKKKSAKIIIKFIEIFDRILVLCLNLILFGLFAWGLYYISVSIFSLNSTDFLSKLAEMGIPIPVFFTAATSFLVMVIFTSCTILLYNTDGY